MSPPLGLPDPAQLDPEAAGWVEARRQVRVRAAAGLVVLALGAALVLVARDAAGPGPQAGGAAQGDAPSDVRAETVARTQVAPAAPAPASAGRRTVPGLPRATTPGGDGLLVVEGDVAGVAWIDDVEAGAVRGFVPVELAAGPHRLEVRTTTGVVRVRVRVEAGILQRVRVAERRPTG
ncbi:MAG: hypothetical protein RLZZ299_1024 [Pseudomonadota bacterium]